MEVSSEEATQRDVPSMEVPLWLGRQHAYCVVVPVINEGRRISNLLSRMQAIDVAAQADIVIVDGGSSDGSVEPDALKRMGVRGLLIKTGPGKLSAQLRCAYAFALDQGYRGIVTIDGNDKDDPEAIARFLAALEGGVDFVQGSRFVEGGREENTPLIRKWAIRCIHAPILSFASGQKWTDTTQGYRGYSRRMLLDAEVAPFRNVFCGYELLAYLSYRAPRLGYRCQEIATVRRYPQGVVPTKVKGLRGQLSLLRVLLVACVGGYDPEQKPS